MSLPEISEYAPTRLTWQVSGEAHPAPAPIRCTTLALNCEQIGTKQPSITDQTDVHRIAKRAASIATQGEQLWEPVLTYDGNPSRLAWKVEAKSAFRGTRLLFVAGTAVYEPGGAQGLVQTAILFNAGSGSRTTTGTQRNFYGNELALVAGFECIRFSAMENHDVRFNLTGAECLIGRAVAQMGQVPMWFFLRTR